MRLASVDFAIQLRPGGGGGRVQPGHHEHHRRITGTQICLVKFLKIYLFSLCSREGESYDQTINPLKM